MFGKATMIAAALLLVSGVQAQIVSPASGDIMLNVSRGDGTFQSRYVDTVKTGALQFLMFGQDPTPGSVTSPPTLRVQQRTLGPSIVCGALSGSTCDVVATAVSIGSSQINDATATGRALLTATDTATARSVISSPSVSDLTSGLSGKAATVHTHVSSDITDSTAFGRAILTAVDYAAQRSLLSVLTASEIASGYYPLSGNPSAFITSAALSPYLTSATAASTYATSASMTTALSAKADSSAMTTALAAKQNTLSLTTTGSGAATLVGSTLNIPTPIGPAARSFSNPARLLNTAFQISATRDASVVYTVDISVTSVLLAGASGRVYLEYADDSGFTTNVVTVNSSPNATGGVLNVTNLGGGNVSGWIPAGKYVRIRTQNVSQTPTFTFQGSQEVLQ